MYTYLISKTMFRALCQKLDIHLICVVDHIHTHYALKVYLVFVFDENLEKHVVLEKQFLL